MSAKKKSRTPAVKINYTKKYDMFICGASSNRELDIARHKKLKESMIEYGFLVSFPLSCYKDPKSNKWNVKDGQHRLTLAEDLNTGVYWVEEVVDYDVATINCTPKPWVPMDYAVKFQNEGKSDYTEGIEFAASHKIPIMTGFALLAGVINSNLIKKSFNEGSYKVKDRDWADLVAGVYCGLLNLSPQMKRNARLCEACIAICRVDNFKPKRLLQNASGCREKLVPYSTKDAYLGMLEEVYNYNVNLKNHVGLCLAAKKAMRLRNPCDKSNKEE